MTYQTSQNTPEITVTIRIRKARAAAWLPVTLLATAPGWVQVDDGAGPLWVMISHVHLADWPKLSPESESPGSDKVT